MSIEMLPLELQSPGPGCFLMNSAPVGMRVLSLTWGVHKTKMSFKSSPACNHCPDDDLEHSEIIYIIMNIFVTMKSWSRAGVMPVRDLAEQEELWRRADSAVGQSCRAGLLGMEGGTKWVVCQQLSSTYNSKATQEAVAVWMCKGETVQVKQVRKIV